MGSEHVVCLPRTPAAAARLPRRAAVLRALAGLGLGFRTPEPLARGGAPGSDEEPFLVLGRIPGEPLEPAALHDARVADAVAAQYAALLAVLDRAGADARVRAVLPHAPEGRWRRFAGDVRAELFVLMSGSGRLRAERELAALDGLPHLTGAVVHGDLGAENVLWEWEHGLPRLAGVLDWDDVELGDRPRTSQPSAPPTATTSWGACSPRTAGRSPVSPPARPRSAAPSPCSRLSTPDATATRRSWRTAWPATAETHRPGAGAREVRRSLPDPVAATAGARTPPSTVHAAAVCRACRWGLGAWR